MDEIGAVGHRVVHGGEEFFRVSSNDDRVKKVIKDCFDIAPLHNPPNLMGIDACQELMPNVNM
jgi:acetate kinase